MKVAIIGAGHRGRMVYARELNKYNDVTVVSFVDIDDTKLKSVSEEFSISSDYLFNDYNAFFKKLDEDLFVDTIVIATTDQEHFDITMKALDYDVDILLEKPISPKVDEVFKIAEKARNRDNILMICHVMRYAPFFTTLKEILDSGDIGDIVTITHNESVGYFHYAHSFVRGNWRKESESSPMLLQKSCHDMDIILYLTGKNPVEISSFGTLKYFTQDNKPKESADRCLNCEFIDSCIYSVKDFYTTFPGYGWRDLVDITYTEKGLEDALRNGNYGKCVWSSDNDVCDHQTVNILMEDDVTVSFTLSAFTSEIKRDFRITGTKGEVVADELKENIEVKIFGDNLTEDSIGKASKYVSINRYDNGEGGDAGHGGGDYGLVKSFVKGIKGDREKIVSGSKESVMSHIMCFAAEYGRKNNVVVNINDYIDMKQKECKI